jgi:hypothetical protein
MLKFCLKKFEMDNFDASIDDIDQWGEDGVATKLLNITTTIEGVGVGDDVNVHD